MSIMTTSSSSSSSSLVLIILHHLRLCLNYLLSFFGHTAGSSNSGGIRIISLANLVSPLLLRPPKPRDLLTFDNGTQVQIGDQIAEGGFSYVFEAFPYGNNGGATSKKYALKRINCSSDYELLQSCRHEAGIHRSLPANHPNLLELLGLKFEQDHHHHQSSSSSSLSEEYNVCYMLFPNLPNSLRGEITLRNILQQTTRTTTRRRPFTTAEALHLFAGILDGLTAMHHANISHRDVKLENILLSLKNTAYAAADHRSQRNNNTSSSSALKFTPILMDFGSAGPLHSPPLTTRNSIFQIIELASTHTTFSYRPPELSSDAVLMMGGRNYNKNLQSSSFCDDVLDYGKVDVWSLGCVLFGILHGVSPFEMEFVKSSYGGGNSSYGGNSYGYGKKMKQTNKNDDDDDGGSNSEQYGLVRIVECTTLKILGEVPNPPWMMGNGVGGGDNNNNNNNKSVGDGRDGRYSLSMYKFIRYMIQQDRMSRPNIHEVAKRFGELYYELLKEEWIPYSKTGGVGSSNSSSNNAGVEGNDDGEYQHDDFDSLIASRDFV